MFHVVESFNESKTGKSEACEDFWAQGEHWISVCDGVTDKSGLLFNGERGGRVIARTVVQAVAAAPRGITAVLLVESVTEACRAVLGEALEQTPVTDYPACSFVALNKTTGKIVRVGDTSWRTPEQVHMGSIAIDKVTTETRAAVLTMELAAGASMEDLRNNDPGRVQIFPLLRNQGLLRNRTDIGDLGYGVIDTQDVPHEFIEEWQLDFAEEEVVLASDGYPELHMSLDESEACLRAVVQEDPLLIHKHKGTKSVPVGAVAYDDRTFVRLTRP